MITVVQVGRGSKTRVHQQKQPILVKVASNMFPKPRGPYVFFLTHGRHGHLFGVGAVKELHVEALELSMSSAGRNFTEHHEDAADMGEEEERPGLLTEFLFQVFFFLGGGLNSDTCW